jgi:glycosyltransferase involved in cell wall biosynthesis
MRVLFVIRTLNPAWGGPVQGFKNLSTQAQKHGLEVEVACVDDPSSAWLKGWHLPVHAVGKGALGMYGYSGALNKWLAANIERFDAVVVHSIWMYFSYAVWKAATRRRIPYYLFIHGALDPWFQQYYPSKNLKKKLYWRFFESKVMRDAAAVLFTTEEEKELAHNAFLPYQCNPAVVGYGITSPPGTKGAVDRMAAREEFSSLHPELKGRKFCLYLSRIHEKKGIDLLLESYARLKNEYEDTALVMAGPGDAATVEKFQALSRQLGLAERVLWTGPLYENAKWAVMRAADMYILPSHQENFGISVVEALACHTPALISNKVNIWREVERESAGLVEADTLEGTTNLLKRWAALTQHQQEAMREQARACYEQYFDVETNSRIFIDLIRNGSSARRDVSAEAVV